MINFIQLNQNLTSWESNIITDKIWETIHGLLYKKKPTKKTTKNDNLEKTVLEYIHEISIQYNTDKKNIIKNYFNYIIRNKKEFVTPALLNIIEGIMHSNDSNIDHILKYFIHAISTLYTKN